MLPLYILRSRKFKWFKLTTNNNLKKKLTIGYFASWVLLFFISKSYKKHLMIKHIDIMDMMLKAHLKMLSVHGIHFDKDLIVQPLARNSL